MSWINKSIAEMDKIKQFKKLQKSYHSIIINHCKNGNLQDIMSILEKEPLLKRINPYIFIATACKNNHFNIIKYLMDYFDETDLNTEEDNIFNQYCRKNKINTLKNIIKITQKNKKVINFNIIESREYGIWVYHNGVWVYRTGPIITRIKNPVILSYLESCGAKLIDKKLII